MKYVVQYTAVDGSTEETDEFTFEEVQKDLLGMMAACYGMGDDENRDTMGDTCWLAHQFITKCKIRMKVEFISPEATLNPVWGTEMREKITITPVE